MSATNKKDELILSHNNIEQFFQSIGMSDTATESMVSSTLMEIQKIFDFETTTELNLNNIMQYKEITTFEATAKSLNTFTDGMITAIHNFNKTI